MKRCPKCDLTYSDETLDFCLDDGTRLNVVSRDNFEPPTILSGSTKSGQNLSSLFPNTNDARFAEINSVKPLTPENFQDETKQKIAQLSANNSSGSAAFPPEQTNQNSIKAQKGVVSKTVDSILSVVPIVLALANNYWQWLYLIRPNAFVFPAFLWSINFIVWILLLIGGVGLSVLALKRNAGKSLAITSLIILAINFLLCLVPARN